MRKIRSIQVLESDQHSKCFRQLPSEIVWAKKSIIRINRNKLNIGNVIKIIWVIGLYKMQIFINSYEVSYILSSLGRFPSSGGKTPEKWLYSMALHIDHIKIRSLKTRIFYNWRRVRKIGIIKTHKLVRVEMFAKALGIGPVSRFTRRELKQ